MDDIGDVAARWLLEMHAGDLHQPFLELFDFHTFGERYRLQLNHTYPGLAFAQARHLRNVRVFRRSPEWRAAMRRRIPRLPA